MSVNFKKGLYFNGYEFFSHNDLANFIIEHFSNCIKLVEDDSIFNLLKEGDIDLYNELFEKTKDFKYCENILTYIIYRLSSSTKFVTLNHRATSTYELAIAMKRCYPNIDNDINVLFKDNVLSTIFWDEYLFTNDVRHKRNHDFLKSVEDNSDFVLSYYYFLILHLPSNDNVTFVLDNNRFTNINDLLEYIHSNTSNIKQTIEEVKRNDYALALIASKTNINSVLNALKSNDYLDFLCLINSMNQNNDVVSYDYSLLLNEKISVWLFHNFHNYEYTSKASKKLLREYSSIIRKNNLSYIEQFNEVKKFEILYKKFISLSKSNKIVDRKQQIIASSKEYHFGYIHNGEIVCSKYLFDLELNQTDINSNEYVLAEEKSLVINELDEYSINLENTNTNLNNYYNLFDKNRYNHIFFKSKLVFMNLFIILLGLICSLFNFVNYSSKAEEIINSILSFSSICLLGVCLLFVLNEFTVLTNILHTKHNYKSLTKKINKSKLKITKLKFYYEEDSDEIVKKKIKINYINKINSFIDKSNKKINKLPKIKEINFDILFKVTLGLAFLPSIILFNKILFSIINIDLIYPVVVAFPIFYILFSILNIVLLIFKKPYRNSYILLIFTIILTIVINLL